MKNGIKISENKTTGNENCFSRVLAIDDDEVNNEIVEEVLGEEFEIKSLLTGKECEKEIERYHPQLLLLDIMMPDVNGYELCRRLKAQPKTAETRIIMVSAKNMVEDRLAAYEAGADDYISKPFVCEELLAKVRVHIRLRYVEELNRLKYDMLKLISHETRTPLNGIVGNAWLLEQSQHLTFEERGYAEEITKSARVLMNLIERSELFLYLQQDQQIEKESLSVREVINQVAENKRVMAEQRNVSLEVIKNKTLELPVLVSRELIEIALGNLVDNGIKYGRSRIWIECNSDDSQVQFIVSDDGSGVAPEFRKNMFAPFSVADLSHHTTGHGINLAITKRVARVHGGDLLLDRTCNCGARFILTISR